MAAPPPSESPRLRVRFGREIFSLGSQRAVVGRSRSCEIRLRDDTVSRLHAAFVWREGDLVLEDLGSSNGTFLNGTRVEEPRSVVAGDGVRFGSLRGTVEPADARVPEGERAITDAARSADNELVAGEPAGFGWRALAVVLDVVLIAVGSLIPFAPLLATLLTEHFLLAPDVIPPGLRAKALIAAGCGVLWVLFAFTYLVRGWARRGGTPAMRLLGLSLIDWHNRAPIGYARAWLRLAGTLVTVLSLGVGFLLIPFRRDRKALHDLLAGTQVVRRAHPLGPAPPPA